MPPPTHPPVNRQAVVFFAVAAVGAAVGVIANVVHFEMNMREGHWRDVQAAAASASARAQQQQQQQQQQGKDDNAGGR